MDADTAAMQRILAREFEQIVLRRKIAIKTKENHAHSSSFLQAEKAGDDARRQVRACNNFTGERGDVRYLPDTVGLCLSGGGLPAVAFASGALHALAKGGYLQLVDYISCAEEGTLTAACLLSHLSSTHNDPSPMGNHTHDTDAVAVDDHAPKFVLASERAMHQLRNYCTQGCRISRPCALEAFVLFVSTVVIPPLLVLSAAAALSIPIDSLIGQTLRQLLTTGLSSFRWYHTGSLVIFAPLFCSCACLAAARILAFDQRLSHDLRRFSPLDMPWSQAAAAAAALGLSVAGLVVVMFVDERLLGGAPLHLHVHPAAFLAIWLLARLAAHAHLLPSSICLPPSSPATTAAAIVVCGVWVAARELAGRVMGRLGPQLHSAADVVPLLALAALVWAQRACFDVLARLYRRRLRAALPSRRSPGRSPIHASPTMQPLPSSPSALRLGDVYHGTHRPTAKRITALPAAVVASVSGAWRKMTECGLLDWGEDGGVGDGDDWPLSRLGGGNVPFLLACTSVSGYAPPCHNASEKGTGSEGGYGVFVVSPVWCGSGPTGFFRTPAWMTLSRVVAICCSDGPLAGPGRLGPALRASNRIRLPTEEEAQEEW
jgi:hypothetical protein